MRGNSTYGDNTEGDETFGDDTFGDETRFFGRQEEIEYISLRATGFLRGRTGMVVSGASGIGKSALLRRVCQRLSSAQDRVLPVLVGLSPYDDGPALAGRILSETLKRFLDFSRGPHQGSRGAASTRYLTGRSLRELMGLLEENSTATTSSIAATSAVLAAAARRHLDLDIGLAGSGSSADIARTCLENAFSLPALIREAEGVQIFLVLDDVDCVGRSTGAGAGTRTTGLPGSPVETAADAFGAGSVGGGPGGAVIFFGLLCESAAPFVASVSGSSGFARPDYGNSKVERIDIHGLSRRDSIEFMAGECADNGIGFETETLGAVAMLLGGNPLYMKDLAFAATRSGGGLSSLKAASLLYAEAVTTGSLAAAFSSLLEGYGLTELKVLDLLCRAQEAHESKGAGGDKGARGAKYSGPGLSTEEVSRRASITPEQTALALSRLSGSGLVSCSLGIARWCGPPAARDFIGYVSQIELRGKSRDEARSGLLGDILKRCFAEQGQSLREDLAGKVAALLNDFDGQRVPRAIFRNALPLAPPKPPEQAEHAAPAEGDRVVPATQGDEIILPFITGSYASKRLSGAGVAETGAGPETGAGHEPPILPILPILIGPGFQGGRFESSTEVTWLVGVKDSELPFGLEDAEVFIEKSTLLARRLGTDFVSRWVVARGGFTEQAARVLSGEGVWVTGLEAFDRLRDLIGVASITPGTDGVPGYKDIGLPLKRFELEVPMSSGAELVAAVAAEEVAREAGFNKEDAAMVKAAVVEACINAMEHSKIGHSKAGHSKAGHGKAGHGKVGGPGSQGTPDAGGPTSGRIMVRLVAATGGLSVEVMNPGRVFDCLEDAPVPRAGTEGSLPSKRGWGFEIIKELMDECRLEKLKDGTRLVMVKVRRKDKTS